MPPWYGFFILHFLATSIYPNQSPGKYESELININRSFKSFKSLLSEEGLTIQLFENVFILIWGLADHQKIFDLFAKKSISQQKKTNWNNLIFYFQARAGSPRTSGVFQKSVILGRQEKMLKISNSRKIFVWNLDFSVIHIILFDSI